MPDSLEALPRRPFTLTDTLRAKPTVIGKTLATDFVSAEMRASGVGLFSATVGLSGLFASVVGGELWTRYGPASTFLFGATMSAVGTAAAVFLVPKGPPEGGHYV